MSRKSFEQIIQAQENGWHEHGGSAGTTLVTKAATLATDEIVLTDIAAFGVYANWCDLVVYGGGAGTAVIWQTAIASKVPFRHTFKTCPKTSAGTGLSAEILDGTNSTISISGYVTS